MRERAVIEMQHRVEFQQDFVIAADEIDDMLGQLARLFHRVIDIAAAERFPQHTADDLVDDAEPLRDGDPLVGNDRVERRAELFLKADIIAAVEIDRRDPRV